jgi:hypothetical protein
MLMTEQVKYTASDCARRYGVTRAEWYKMVERGEAPEPTQQQPRKQWSIDVLIAWEENVLAACDGLAR